MCKERYKFRNTMQGAEFWFVPGVVPGGPGTKRTTRRPSARNVVLPNALAGLFEHHRNRDIPVTNHLFRDDQLLDLLVTRHVVHQVQHQLLQDHAQAARAHLALQRVTSNRPGSLVGPGNLHALILEQLGVLLQNRIPRARQDVDQGSLVQLVQDAKHWQTADELRDEPVLQQILRFRLAEHLRVALRTNRGYLGSIQVSVGDRLEAERLLADAAGDDLLETDKRATADKEDVRRVNNRELLVRVLASALRRDIRNCAFEQLQQRLLHTLARNVTGDGGVFVLAADLVNLVNVDDAALGACHITVGGLQQLQNNVLDVLTDVAGFGQRRCVDDRKRNVQHLRQRLRHQRLTGTRRTHEQDVRLREFHIGGPRAVHLDALVGVVDRNRQLLLRGVLTDDVLVQKRLDLGGFGQVRRSSPGLCLALVVFQDGVADPYALVADIGTRIVGRR